MIQFYIILRQNTIGLLMLDGSDTFVFQYTRKTVVKNKPCMLVGLCLFRQGRGYTIVGINAQNFRVARLLLKFNFVLQGIASKQNV